MIALIEGQLYDLAPLTITNGEFSIGMNDKGDIEAYIGEKRIDYGVLFFSMNKCVDIEAKTGKTTVNYSGKAKIRGIFGSFMREIEVQINEVA